MDSLTINIVNNNNKKVYTSFLTTDEKNQKITTDSQQSRWQPPVLHAAKCECDTRESQSMICTETKQTVRIPVISDGKSVTPASIIYFSFSPGYAGGNDGAFDSIPVNYSFVSNGPPPTYNLKNMNDKCKNIGKNVLIPILLLIISLVLIIIGIIRHNKLWLLGIFFLILAFIVGYLSFRNKSNN